MNAAPRSTWPVALVGVAGSCLTAYGAPRALNDRVVGWWYAPSTPSSAHAGVALVLIGAALLCAAWLALGRNLPPRGVLLLIAAAWALPLALAPPLFSRDVYSYLAQGTILHLGHSPYHSAPRLLATLGRPRLLAAVSPFWRGTTAPYGPLFLGVVSLISGAVGSQLIAGVLLIRLLECSGVALLAIAVPRLARALGTDERRALWLALLSPLVMLQLIAAAHNDVIMDGLLAAGIACALSGRPLLGIAVCTLAATIKVPALAGAVFVAVAWARAEPRGQARLRFAAAAGLVIVGVLTAVTLAARVGPSWISTAVVSTPARVRLAITPATALGYTVHSVLSDLGIAAGANRLEHAFVTAALVPTALAVLVLLYRARIRTVTAALGACLIIAAAGGPAAWPWYFTWGLTLLAAVRSVQVSTVLPVGIAASVFLVKPSGQLALPLPRATEVLVIYVLITAGVVWRRHRRGDGTSGAPRNGTSGAPRDGTSGAPRDGTSGAPRDGTSGAPGEPPGELTVREGHGSALAGA